jgi:predicted peptidase
MEWGYGWNPSVLSALLDEIEDRYRVDVDSVHVTGFSMGGYGTWDLGMHSAKRFATLMPICGGGDTGRASLLKDVPHWVHHGDRDDIIPVQASIQMVNALKKAGASDEMVKFTRYEGMMHDSWTAAYNNVEVYRWMLGHRRHTTGQERVVPESNKGVVAE